MRPVLAGRSPEKRRLRCRTTAAAVGGRGRACCRRPRSWSRRSGVRALARLRVAGHVGARPVASRTTSQGQRRRAGCRGGWCRRVGDGDVGLSLSYVAASRPVACRAARERSRGGGWVSVGRRRAVVWGEGAWGWAICRRGAICGGCRRAGPASGPGRAGPRRCRGRPATWPVACAPPSAWPG